MIIFIGAPGSGKGTQARLLAKRDGYEIFSVGEILRQEVEKETAIGLRIRENMTTGNFVDLDIVIDLMRSKIEHDNFVLDGFPRTIDQANEFENFVKQNDFIDWGKVVVVNFEVPDEVLVSRLQNRRICNICDGSILLDAQECMFCGHCSSNSYKRCDDVSVAITNRLKQYHEQSQKLVKFYSDKGNYQAIDATMDMEDVYQAMKSILKI